MKTKVTNIEKLIRVFDFHKKIISDLLVAIDCHVEGVMK